MLSLYIVKAFNTAVCKLLASGNSRGVSRKLSRGVLLQACVSACEFLVMPLIFGPRPLFYSWMAAKSSARSQTS